VETADERNEPGTAEESNSNYSPAASLSSQVSLKASSKKFLDFFCLYVSVFVKGLMLPKDSYSFDHKNATIVIYC
jgi:hypothetical protein